MNQQNEAIGLRGAVKDFRTGGSLFTAVGGVDLSIPRGEIVALLGPNGAGKTTTLDMVLGLTTPTAGSVSVFGEAPRRAIRAGHVSAVLQTGGLLRDLSVRETMMLVASTFKDPMPVDAAMERANITSLAKRKVSKCSGGEQQRLRFALALLPDPSLLILDEPTAGMDVTARAEFWATMREDARAGRTVVFATHYLEEADSFAQRIVMMAGGRVVADGTTAEIRATATGRRVQAYVPASRQQETVAALEAMPEVLAVTADAGRLVVTAADSDAVARALLTGLEAHDLEISAGSMDDAFRLLTERNAS
ncbi:ABC transporter ATP-binding protein [Microbacterium sorbitolivorans]|uniref:ABC transporter ATP-binding protein n=1 Tax=Microbacterium sorbitolivorans TaxID=1867410 RepID=A0A367XY90_9MICO|nr:ABC transporter ATP-binding protein [Microbacterium sorbitolivorans]RCK58563.1 ABC transporter ATP-binding protein [Microbacterium sorbitolivorans]GGF37537.1 ABC transporter ATP-binding protein [Microbacterium sorbitolivorans]